MQKFLSLIVLCFVAFSFNPLAAQKTKKAGEYYQLTIYRFTSPEQEKILDEHLKNYFIPALHKSGIKTVGVFKAIANDTAALKSLYVLVPVKSLNAISEISQRLMADKNLNNSDYINTAYNSPAYSRMETIILKSFHLASKMNTPILKSSRADRVYELRSYESPSEKMFRNKLHMFNEGGETAIFKKLNFNAVFYGEVIAGSRMPNLMYMTSFENMEDRKAHWKSFSSDPDWKKLSGREAYKNNVSKIDITFLRPADYSDF